MGFAHPHRPATQRFSTRLSSPLWQAAAPTAAWVGTSAGCQKGSAHISRSRCLSASQFRQRSRRPGFPLLQRPSRSVRVNACREGSGPDMRCRFALYISASLPSHLRSHAAVRACMRDRVPGSRPVTCPPPRSGDRRSAAPSPGSARVRRSWRLRGHLCVCKRKSLPLSSLVFADGQHRHRPIQYHLIL